MAAISELQARRLARTQLRYLITLTSFVALALSLIGGLNFLVDPLLYHSGVHIAVQTYWFNLRTSKVNLFMQDRNAYDCLIFGSSVTTLLNASKIRGYNCFNAAIDGTNAEELVIYARYFRDHLGVKPRLVIVGLEPADLGAVRPSSLHIPRFIREGKSPPPILLAYLSYDALWFSFRSALGMIHHPVQCTREFVCHLTPQKMPLKPAEMLAGTVNAASIEDFHRDALAVYAELLETWPQARTIGYAPFVNAWAVAAWQKKGILEAYLEAVHSASMLFDEFYDFTAPSRITMDVTQTSDGEHYSSLANDLIVAQFNGDQSSLGLAVHGRSYKTFRDLYLGQLAGISPDILSFVNSHIQ